MKLFVNWKMANFGSLKSKRWTALKATNPSLQSMAAKDDGQGPRGAIPKARGMCCFQGIFSPPLSVEIAPSLKTQLINFWILQVHFAMHETKTWLAHHFQSWSNVVAQHNRGLIHIHRFLLLRHFTTTVPGFPNAYSNTWRWVVRTFDNNTG